MNRYHEIIRKVSVLFILCLISIGSFSQQVNDKRERKAVERAIKQTERMTKQLSLSKKQARAIKEINLKYSKKMTALHKTYKKQHTKAKAIRQQQAEEIENILTEKQAARFKIMKKRRKDKMKRNARQQ